MDTAIVGTAGIQGPLWGARPRDYAEQEAQAAGLYASAIEITGISAGTKVLDVGCATGVFAKAAADAGADVTGLDAAGSLVELARQRVPAGDFRVGELQQPPFEDATFDVITAFNAIQYAADPAAAVAELKRIAKPGGRVFVLVWGREDRTELVAALRALGPLLPAAPTGAPGPFALSYPGALERVLTNGGLRIEADGYLETAFEYPDDAALLRANLSTGPAILAARRVGEETVSTALLSALAEFRESSGAYRIETEWRYVVGTA